MGLKEGSSFWDHDPAQKWSENLFAVPFSYSMFEDSRVFFRDAPSSPRWTIAIVSMAQFIIID